MTRLIKSRQLRGSSDTAICGQSNQEVTHADFSHVALGINGTCENFAPVTTAKPLKAQDLSALVPSPCEHRPALLSVPQMYFEAQQHPSTASGFSFQAHPGVHWAVSYPDKGLQQHCPGPRNIPANLHHTLGHLFLCHSPCGTGREIHGLSFLVPCICTPYSP